MEAAPTAPALMKAVATPIRQLSPSVEFEKARYVRAAIVLLWPFSSTTKELKLLISEPDFRLRSSHGQIRVTCRNRVAEAVAKSQAGIGDTVLLGLDGVRWEKRSDESSFGGEAEWSLVFSERIILEVHRDSNLLATVDVDSKPQQKDEVMRDGSPTTNLETPVVDRHWRTSTEIVASPFRLANGSPFGFLAEEDGYIFGKGRKRTKFGRPSSEWIFVDSPPSPVEKATDWETDDIEARLQEYESPEPAGPTDTAPPSPTPQTGHSDTGIVGVTNGAEAGTPAEFLDDTVSPVGKEDAEVLEAENVYRGSGVEKVGGIRQETQKEAEAPEILKPSGSNEQFEEVGQDQAESRSPVAEEHGDEQLERTEEQHMGRGTNVERNGSNELEDQPSPIPVPSQARMVGNGYEPKSPSKLDGESRSPPKPDSRGEGHLNHSPALEKSKSPQLSSPSRDIETTAPMQYNPFLAKSEPVGSEEDELEQKLLGGGRLSVVDRPDVQFTFQGTRRQEASVSTHSSVVEEEQEPSVEHKAVPDGVSIPPQHVETTEARDGSEDSDIEMVSDRERPEVDRIAYGDMDQDGDLSETSSGYYSDRDGSEEIESISEEYEPERRRDVDYESRSNAEEDSFWDDSESDIEEDGGNQQLMAQKTAKAEVIVIDSDDESDVSAEPEGKQRPEPDVEQLAHVNAGSTGQPEDDISSHEVRESETSDVDSQSDEGSKSVSSRDGDTRIEEPGPEKSNIWLDGAHYDASTSISSAQQNQLPGQSFLATMERQSQGPVPEAVPEQETQGPLESRSQPMAFDSMTIHEPQEHVQPTATKETTARNETEKFEYRETLHAETQMATPADTQETAAISHTPPIVTSHDLPSPLMSQELQATIETADELKAESRTESAGILNETQPSPVYPEDMEVDTASDVMQENQEPLVPMASGALLETIKEEAPVEDFVDALSTVERSTASPTPSFESAREYSSDVEPKSEQVSQLSSPAMGRRTRLGYFCPLSGLLKNFDSAIDTISVVASSSPVSQATHKPFDHYVTLHVMDPSTEGSTVCAQVFCQDEDNLPVASKGDVILLRNFKVSSADHKAMLCSTKISSWAVFIQGDGHNVWIAGPPVEYNDDERAYVAELRQWYLEEGAELLEKRELLSSRASTETSMTGTSDAGSTASTRGGKKISKRRKQKSTPRRLTVHELRHGRRYTDTSPSDKESIHELRNGTLYAHL